jgi:Ulp1 protease family, C-terminal catalytic domain
MRRQYKCDTEFCLVTSLPGVGEGLKAYFRPEKPDEWDKKATTWLDSYNIEDVMNQYEEAYPEFEFIGPVPIDFDARSGAWGKCIVDELCKLDIREAAKKGTKKIGIIYNLDKHDEPGSHWVCSFVDIPGRAAYFFDSYGYRPPPEVERFMARCKEQGCDRLYYNDVRHQRKGSECGMYSLFVIICLLKGRSFYDICTKIVDDDTMNSFRDILFATEKPRREAIEEALPRLCI